MLPRSHQSHGCQVSEIFTDMKAEAYVFKPSSFLYRNQAAAGPHR